jgi:hypothetical protein
MLPQFLNIKKKYELVRFGKDNDGGYLIEKNSIINSEILISAGISWDFSFEEDYLKKVNKKVCCYDHTLNFKHYFTTWMLIFLTRILKFSNFLKIKSAFNNMLKPLKLQKFFKNKQVEYFNLGIGLKNEKILELNEILSNHKNLDKIFLKIDIERDEYRVLDDIIKFQNKINGLVIEFHDFDLNIDKIENFIKSFKCNLVHIHPNNSGPIGKNNIPSILECSFAKYPRVIGDRTKIKHELDQPNIKGKEDIDLKFERE